MPKVIPAKPKWGSLEAFTKDLYLAAQATGLSAEASLLVVAWVYHEVGPTEAKVKSGITGFNLTGVKVTSEAQEAKYSYFEADTFEVASGRTVSLKNAKWRAWDTLSESMADMLSLLDQAKFLQTRAALRAGHRDFFTLLQTEPREISRYLGQWYTAHVDDYRRACWRRVYQACSVLGVEPPLYASLTQAVGRQKFLKGMGLYAGPIDGDVGPNTKAGIVRWQKALAQKLGVSVAADGAWGDLTTHATLVYLCE